MVEATLRVIDPNVGYTPVHATRGKVVRAQPVAALYEQARIRHIGAFPKLEDQLCTFTPDMVREDGDSPDRGDALVWAFYELLVEPIPGWGIYEATRRQAEALVAEKAARLAARTPKPQPAPGSVEWQALQNKPPQE